MSTEACKAALPLPRLLVKLGYPEPDRSGFLPSPLRPGESGNSFHVFEQKGQWFYKDHATGERGGDEVNFLMALRGLSNRAAIELYHELAGVDWRKAPDGALKRADHGAQPRGQGASLGKPSAIYVYENADGAHAFEVLRFITDKGGKTFRQRRHAREGERSSNGWVWRVEEADRVLYHLPQVLAQPSTEPIFLVEGEKDADAVTALGLVATCNAAGAGKWQANYTASLAAKWVVMIGDNDEAGRAHLATVSELLRPVVARLGVIDIGAVWRECPEKGDVFDFIAAAQAAEREAV